MIIRNAWALCALSFLLTSSGIVKAGTLTTIDDTVAADLANALTTGGAGGITITSESLSSNHFVTTHNNKDENIDSSGVFSTVGPNNFGLSGSGIVISTGNAAQDGTTGPRHFTKSRPISARPQPRTEASLLNQVGVGAIRLERRHGIRHHLYSRAEHQPCLLQHCLHLG